MYFIFVIYIIVTLACLEALAGVTLQVSESGLNYAAVTAANLFVKRFSTTEIKDEHFRDGDIEGDFSNIKINDWSQQPSIIVKLKPESAILFVSVTVDYLKCSADWRYKYELNRFIKIRDSGSLTVTVDKFTIAVEVTFGFNSLSGKPTILSNGCSSTFSDLDLKFHGKTGIIYNTIAGLAKNFLRKTLEDVLCNSATKAIDNNVNDELSSMTVEARLDGDLYFDYRLASSPEITNDDIKLHLVGTVFGGVVPRQSLASDKPPTCIGPQKMLIGVFSEDSFNSYLKALYLSDKLHHLITRDDLPDSYKPYMDTNCTKASCIVKIVLNNFQPIPNASLEIDWKVIETPTISITQNGISGNVLTLATIYARHQLDYSTTELLQFRVKTPLNFDARVENDLLKFRIQRLNPSIELPQGDKNPVINENGLTFVIKLAKKLLEVEANKLGEKGVPLPKMKNIELNNLEVAILDGALCVLTDIDYKATD